MIYVHANVPEGAVVPTFKFTKYPVFTVQGSNVLCSMQPGSVRCALRSRFWTIPGAGKACQPDFVAGVTLLGTGMPKTFCTNATLKIPKDTPIVKPGYDNVYAGQACEVRSFGVDCFLVHHHGFLVSRTGYELY